MSSLQRRGLADPAERAGLVTRLRADVGAEAGGDGRRVLHAHLQEQVRLQPAHRRPGRRTPFSCAAQNMTLISSKKT